jgi:predicted nucleic acid-binding protein
MENSVCLDTDILIDFLRNKGEVVDWIIKNEEKNVFSTTIINLFELYFGAYKSQNFQDKISAVKKLEEKLKIIYFSEKSAETAGRIGAELEKKGNLIDKRDLFIGTIALTEGYAIKTNNKKHFSRIDGLSIVD